MKDASAALFVLRSENKKLGDVAVTYASIEATCPKTCPLKGDGCYAGLGRVALYERKLSHDRGPLGAAKDEWLAIKAGTDGLPLAGRPLRLHVSGDARTVGAARTMARIQRYWSSKDGGPVWSYTHAWRNVDRLDWGGVSVLASVETVADAMVAHEMGYSAAIVTWPHASPKSYKVGGMTIIPCPNQTRGVKCDACRLCFDDKKLHERRAVIAFEAHGVAKGFV